MRERRERKYSKATYVYQPNCMSAKILIEIRTMLLYFFDPKMVKSDLRGNIISEKLKAIARTKRYRFTSDEIKHFFLTYLMSEVIKQVTRDRVGAGKAKCGRWEILNPLSVLPPGFPLEKIRVPVCLIHGFSRSP